MANHCMLEVCQLSPATWQMAEHTAANHHWKVWAKASAVEPKGKRSPID